MSQNNDLMEQYEDAMFAILMDHVAQAEGQRALEENQRLKEDPNATVPDSVQKQCKKCIRNAFAAKTRKMLAGVLWRGIHIAAIVVLLLAATMAVSFAAFPTLRANVINTILDSYDTHTDFSFTSESEGSASPELAISVGWLPEGFELTEENYIFDRSCKIFEKDSATRIVIQKYIPTESSISIDTEDAKITPVKMHDYDATLIEKENEARIIWLDTRQNIVYFVNTDGLSTSTMLTIAQNIS